MTLDVSESTSSPLASSPTGSPVLCPFFGRRKGRPLGLARQHAFEHMLPSWEWMAARSLCPDKPLWLEIGFGFGDHMLAWLQRYPDRHIIGAEVFQNGIAHFLTQVSPQDQARCFLWPRPVEGLWNHLPDQSLDGILVYFPDPWPKARHHKRRLIQPAFLKTCARVMKPQGRIHFASDHADLVDHVCTVFRQDAAWRWVEGVQDGNSQNWPAWPPDMPASRYFHKAVQQGRPCGFGIWELM